MDLIGKSVAGDLIIAISEADLAALKAASKQLDRIRTTIAESAALIEQRVPPKIRVPDMLRAPQRAHSSGQHRARRKSTAGETGFRLVVHQVLAEAGTALKTAELLDLLEKSGTPSTAANPPRALNNMLIKYPHLFRRQGYGRYVALPLEPDTPPPAAPQVVSREERLRMIKEADRRLQGED